MNHIKACGDTSDNCPTIEELLNTANKLNLTSDSIDPDVFNSDLKIGKSPEESQKISSKKYTLACKYLF